MLRIINSMKKYLISLSVILAIITVLVLPSYGIAADDAIKEDAEITEAQKACEDKKPELLQRYEKDNVFVSLKKLQEDVATGEVLWSYGKFQEVFEEIQEQYHSYVECIFNYAEIQILGDFQVKFLQGTTQASMPTLGDVPIIDWLIPEAACIDEKKREEIFLNTSSDALLLPLLRTHNDYSDYLDGLSILYETDGREIIQTESGASTTLVEQVNIMADAYEGINRQIELEKQNALVAMDMAFKSLKELRMALLMHIQFQCIMNDLEEYRRWLEDIRSIVEMFPVMLKDCSMTK